MPASASSARPERKMVNAAERRLFWGTLVAVVVSDFATKLIAESFLARRLPLQVMGDTVQFRLVYRSEEHTSELQSPVHLVCRLLLEKKRNEAVQKRCSAVRPIDPPCQSAHFDHQFPGWPLLEQGG